MKNILIVLVCLTAAMNSFAAPGKTAKKKAKATTTTTTTTTTTKSEKNNYVAPTHSYDTSGDHLRFGAGAALGMIDGHFAFGATLRGDFPIHIESSILLVGAETGFYHAGWSQTSAFSTVSVDASVNAIPVAATAQYNFKLSNSDLSPYIRAALGLDIAMSKANVLGVSVSDTSVKFHFVAEPGVEFGDSNNLFAALQFGTVASGFFLMPTFGIHF